MIFELFTFLAKTHKVPSFFFYTSTRMLLSVLTTLFFTLFMGPFFLSRLYGLKVGRSIRVRDCPVLGELHKKKEKTPTMGGLLFLCGMLLSLLLWMDLTSPYTVILLTTTLWLGLIGGIDDYLKIKKQNSRGIPGRIKFLLQFLLAVGVCYYLYFVEGQISRLLFIPFVKTPLLMPTMVAVTLAIFVIIGSSNAVNLTDGLDGLAAGCVLCSSAVLAFIAFLSNHASTAEYLHLLHIEGSSEVAIYLSAMFGGALGFLWYNSHPAQVFMGDVGSLAWGGLLGVCSVLLRKEILLALIGGIFVWEALSVIIQVLSYRFRGGKRVFLCAPIHHHFEYRGVPETKVVMRFWIISLILAITGLISVKFQ